MPSQQIQSLIYQQQQVENPSSPDYSLNENKILLSIDLMMAKKQQQLQWTYFDEEANEIIQKGRNKVAECKQSIYS